LLQNQALFMAFALLISIAVAAMHLMGRSMGKWISNFGAAAAVGVLLILIAAGVSLALKPGRPATDFIHASYAPPLTADGAILWGTMVFASGHRRHPLDPHPG
jgi:hypothetical protein